MKHLRLIGMIAINFVREQRWPILVLQLSVLVWRLWGCSPMRATAKIF